MESLSLDETYRALAEGAAYMRRLTSDVLRLTGDDRVDFLQRMTTNDIVALKPNESTVTVLTTPTARVAFVFSVLKRNDDLLLLPAPGEASALDAHLRSQIFFMDKVAVENCSADFTRVRVVGPRAADAVATLQVATNELEDPVDRFVEIDGIFVLRQERYDMPGYELLLPIEQTDETLTQLEQEGGAQAVTDEDAYTALRVELGRPAPGRELTEAYTPLEAGLAWTCAENKGCYTGQEIIARQITYDKVTRHLVGLRGADEITVGSAVMADERTVGTVTSAAHSPALDAFVALAIVKRAHSEPGTTLTIDDRSVEVVDLPMV